MEAVATLKQLNANNDSTIDIATWKQSCYDAMNDDFNSYFNRTIIWRSSFINLLHDGKETLNAVDLDIFQMQWMRFFWCIGTRSWKDSKQQQR
jgi:cysteinyl-tRNA synthetase